MRVTEDKMPSPAWAKQITEVPYRLCVEEKIFAEKIKYRDPSVKIISGLLMR